MSFIFTVCELVRVFCHLIWFKHSIEFHLLSNFSYFVENDIFINRFRITSIIFLYLLPLPIPPRSSESSLFTQLPIFIYFSIKAHGYELTVFVTAFTRLAKDQARQNLSVEGGEVHEFLPLAKKLLEISNYWERAYGSGGTERDRRKR